MDDLASGVRAPDSERDALRNVDGADGHGGTSRATGSAMDAMLAAVEWREVTVIPEFDGEVVATHEGELRILGIELRVYQLSNGERVIDADDFLRFFVGMAEDGENA